MCAHAAENLRKSWFTGEKHIKTAASAGKADAA